MIFLIIVILVVAALCAALWGPIISRVEQAKYTVVKSYDNIEIRNYAPLIIAQVQVSGDRQKAINQGFRILADYIFGNNTSTQKIKMTAPVTQQPNNKISIATPFMQTTDGNSWFIQFVMPASYTSQTLPKPNNPSINIKELPKSHYAVIRFSGTASELNLKKHTEKLQYFISANHLATISEPIYAFFNPPWTLPFLRRNEVMVEIRRG